MFGSMPQLRPGDQGTEIRRCLERHIWGWNDPKGSDRMILKSNCWLQTLAHTEAIWPMVWYGNKISRVMGWSAVREVASNRFWWTHARGSTWNYSIDMILYCIIYNIYNIYISNGCDPTWLPALPCASLWVQAGLEVTRDRQCETVRSWTQKERERERYLYIYI